jgi:DNA-binding LacI/PurR family transcriptional regulator
MSVESSRQYNRLQISVSEQLRDKINSYAEMMGISCSEAGRHLMLRGLEQVQMIVNAQESSNTLKSMVECFDRGLAMEEKVPKKKGQKQVEGLVTPPQRIKNDTKLGMVRDVFDGEFSDD